MDQKVAACERRFESGFTPGLCGGQSSARASPQKKKWNFGVVKTKQELREAQGMDPAGSSRGSQTLLGAAGGAAGSQLRVGFAQLSFLKEMGQELLQALGHPNPTGSLNCHTGVTNIETSQIPQDLLDCYTRDKHWDIPNPWRR